MKSLALDLDLERALGNRRATCLREAMPSMGDSGSACALVLSGAVARGAFEAGVVRALVEQGVRFDRLVGASAGALNAVLVAAGIAVGRTAEAVVELERVWLEDGKFLSFFRPVFAPLRGVSSTRGVERLVRRGLATVVGDRARTPVADVKLTLVTTDLHGAMYEGERVHEGEIELDAQAIVDPERWPYIARAAAASAAFPFLFVPPVVDGTQRVDGGAVNNAPISYVIDETVAHNEIFVVSVEPNVPTPSPLTLRGGALVARIIDTLVNERIARDLVVAKMRNETLVELERAMADAGLMTSQRDAVRRALRWRHLDIVPIRPTRELDRSSFFGFFRRSARERYIELGKEAALEALTVRAYMPASVGRAGARAPAPAPHH